MRRFAILLAACLTLLTPAAVARADTIPLPHSMAATGDSITRGFDATFWGCLLSDCPQYSWSTGTSSLVNSEYRRLNAHQALTWNNDAKTGATMAALQGQLGSAATQQADYVTVLMGANDVCTSSIAAMTDPTVFRTEFQDALAAYFAAAPSGAHVFVSSIPNILQLWTVLHTNRSATSTWKSFGICQSMLAATNTAAQRQTVADREAALNAVLADVCTHHPSGRCLWDGYATFNTAFAASDVSTVDYFHPSLSGQNKLAKAGMAAGYWPSY